MGVCLNLPCHAGTVQGSRAWVSGWVTAVCQPALPPEGVTPGPPAVTPEPCPTPARKWGELSPLKDMHLCPAEGASKGLEARGMLIRLCRRVLERLLGITEKARPPCLAWWLGL